MFWISPGAGQKCLCRSLLRVELLYPLPNNSRRILRIIGTALPTAFSGASAFCGSEPFGHLRWNRFPVFAPKSPQTRMNTRKNWVTSFLSPNHGAGNGIRTRDIQLGKLTLYHWTTPAYMAISNYLRYYTTKLDENQVLSILKISP